MIVIHLTTGNRTCDVLKYKSKHPRFRRKNFTGLTVRDTTLELVRALFTGLPDMPQATELHYPGELGMFVFENLMAHLKRSKAAPMKSESEREKYLGRLNKAA